MNNLNPQLNTQNINNQLNRVLNDTNQNNNLQMVLFKQTNGEIKAADLGNEDLSSYEDSFGWLVDEEGKPINFNQNVTVFNGVKLMYHLLDKRYSINKESGRFRGRGKINRILIYIC